MRLGDISIRYKFGGAFALVVFLFAAAEFVAWEQMEGAAGAVRRLVDRQFRAVDMARAAQRDFEILRRHYGIGLAPGGDRGSWSTRYLALHRRLDDDLRQCQFLGDGTVAASNIGTAIKLLSKWDGAVDKGGRHSGAQLEEIASALEGALDGNVEASRTNAEIAASDVGRAVQVGGWTIALGGGVVAIIAMMIAGLLAVDIIGVFGRATKLAQAIATGKLTVGEVPPRHDEAGILYRALRDMANRLQEQTDKLQAMARSDRLTGLPNRARLDEVFATQMKRAERLGERFSIVMVDLDHFKTVNDLHGHQAGDLVLQHISRLLTVGVRDIDTAGRWGGEEFAVVCPGTGIDDAAQLAERLRSTIATHDFPVVGHKTASFGVAEWTKGDDLQAIVKRADNALYAAKDAGRNRVEISRATAAYKATGVGEGRLPAA